MAFDPTEKEQLKQSEFNAGIAKTYRLDELLKRVNNASFNPLAFDMELGKFNYEILFIALNNLFNEAKGKLEQDEKDKGNHLKEAIEGFLMKHPIIIPLANGKFFIEQNHWKVIKPKIEAYQDIIRQMLDDHSLDTPTKEKMRRGF